MTTATVYQYTEPPLVLENVIDVEYDDGMDEVSIKTNEGMEYFNFEDVMRIELSHGKE